MSMTNRFPIPTDQLTIHVLIASFWAAASVFIVNQHKLKQKYIEMNTTHCTTDVHNPHCYPRLLHLNYRRHRNVKCQLQ